MANVSRIGSTEPAMFPQATPGAGAAGANPLSRNPDSGGDMMSQMMKFIQMQQAMRKTQDSTGGGASAGGGKGMLGGKSGGAGAGGDGGASMMGMQGGGM